MVDYAEGKGPPPQALVDGWRARQWGLPEAGGRLDQPAGMVARMTHALNLYELWSGYLAAEARGDGVQWKNSDPQRARAINDLLRDKLARDSG